MNQNRGKEHDNMHFSQKRMAFAVTALAMSGFIALASPASAATVINGSVSNNGNSAGYVLGNDQHTHYKEAQETFTLPADTPASTTLFGTVNLYDQANSDLAELTLSWNSSDGFGAWYNYIPGKAQYDNNLAGVVQLAGATKLPATLAAGDAVTLVISYNLNRSVSFSVQIGNTTPVTAHVTTTHPEQFTEAGYGGGVAMMLTNVEENFYISTGPAEPITMVHGYYGVGGVVRDDLVTGGIGSAPDLSPGASLSSSNNGSFTLAA